MRPGSRVHVALIGLRCAGKTSVGRELALLLARPFVDLDQEIAAAFEREHGPPRWTSGEILAREGEPAFRDLEEALLVDVLARSAPLVIATGGGVVERAANRSRLAGSATCVWLRVELPELARRLRMDATFRPALCGGDPAGEIVELARRREPWYAATADERLECGARGAAELARALAGVLERVRSAPQG